MNSGINSNRVVLIVIAWAIAILVIQGRLFAIQVVSSHKYRQLAQKQHRGKVILPAKRGTIYDRNGVILACDCPHYDFYAEPVILNDTTRQAIDSIFCEIFSRPKGTYLKKMSSGAKWFSYLEQNVDFATAEKILPIKIPGLRFIPTYKRIYPYKQTGASVLGCVSVDNRGIEGIELYYDSLLSGESGEDIRFFDARGNDYSIFTYSHKEPVQGNDIFLTIDIRLQAILEAELRNCVEKNNATSACGVFLDPHTGEILALSSYPNIDPNNPAEFPAEYRRNRVITDLYEPGSIFKIVTISAALDQHIKTTSDTVFCENGKYSLFGKPILDVHPMGKATVTDVIVQSSNIGTVKIATDVGGDNIYEYARRFGFGTPTGVDLPGERAGVLRPPSRWSKLTMRTLPMGYEVSATALQIACAYNAIANDGVLMKPYIVSKVQSGEETIKLNTPVPVRRVVSSLTADTLKYIFRRVVLDGTGQSANSKIVELGGKTGTARKHSENSDGYVDNAYRASFATLIPWDKPVIAGIIVVDEPKAGIYYGGSVAAPVAKAIAENSILHGIFNISQEYVVAGEKEGDTNFVRVPNLINSTKQLAELICSERGLNLNVSGTGRQISFQEPSPFSFVRKKTEIRAVLDSVICGDSDSSVVPHLVGTTVRTAIKSLSMCGLTPKIVGSGTVVEQFPPPGTILALGETCELRCKSRWNK